MKPLEGLRILTVEHFGAGPYGTMFLAGLGAEVIKIENAATGGDPAGTSGRISSARTTASISRPSTMEEERLARSHEGCREIPCLRGERGRGGEQPARRRSGEAGTGLQEPRQSQSSVVCLHISAYGRDNERASWPGYDFLMQAEAGLMDLTGEPEGAPSRFGTSIIDCMSGMTGAAAAPRLRAARQAHRQGLRRRREPVRRRAAPAHLHGHVVPERRRGVHRASRAARISSRRCRPSRPRTAGSSSCA